MARQGLGSYAKGGFVAGWQAFLLGMAWPFHLVVLAMLVLGAAPVGAAPLDIYGRLPSLSDLTLSPDGASIAYCRGNQGKRFVVVQSLANHDVVGMIDLGDAKLRALQWADNHTVIITTSVTSLPAGFTGHRQEYYLAQSFDMQTRKQRALLNHAPADQSGNIDVMNVVAGLPQPRIIDGRTVIFVPGIYYIGSDGHFALFRIDLASNSTRMVSSDHDTHGEDWIVDEAGNIVAESSYYEKDRRWKVKVFHDGQAIEALDVPMPIDAGAIYGLTEDNAAIIVGMPAADGMTQLQQIALKDGGSTPWQRAQMDFGGLLTAARSNRVTGGERTDDRHDYVFFDPQADKMWRSVKAAFPGAMDVDLVSWSDDHATIAAHVFGETYGDTFYLVDMKTHKAEPFGPEYDGLDAVSPERWIQYQASDGRTLHAYLTLPKGREAKNLPLVVLPHGGPHARDDPGFDWLSQSLASRGYLVLQPQFRGSDGFGTELLTAGYGEFGRKMQTDLSDGVRALAAQGLADLRRVCIVGASYGGYAALAGATLDTGVYRCAVSISGLSDLKAQFEYWRWPANRLDDRSNRFWERFLGLNGLDDPRLAALSPIQHVDKVSIPILLIHGRDDTVVPFAQSDDMADALKAGKKSVEFVALKGEDHWLSSSETRLQMLTATARFLEANNPPD